MDERSYLYWADISAKRQAEINRLRAELARTTGQYDQLRAPPVTTDEIVRLHADKAKLLAELELAARAMYNAFEPDNQSQAYMRAMAVVNSMMEDT